MCTGSLWFLWQYCCTSDENGIKNFIVSPILTNYYYYFWVLYRTIYRLEPFLLRKQQYKSTERKRFVNRHLSILMSNGTGQQHNDNSVNTYVIIIYNTVNTMHSHGSYDYSHKNTSCWITNHSPLYRSSCKLSEKWKKNYGINSRVLTDVITANRCYGCRTECLLRWLQNSSIQTQTESYLFMGLLLADHTAHAVRSAIVNMSQCLSVRLSQSALWLNDTSYSKSVWTVNRKCSLPGNRTL